MTIGFISCVPWEDRSLSRPLLMRLPHSGPAAVSLGILTGSHQVGGEPSCVTMLLSLSNTPGSPNSLATAPVISQPIPGRFHSLVGVPEIFMDLIRANTHAFSPRISYFCLAATL